MSANIFLLQSPGGLEWVLIILVVVLLFGGKKIPELMRGLGKGVSEFKKGVKDIEDETKNDGEKKKWHIQDLCPSAPSLERHQLSLSYPVWWNNAVHASLQDYP